MKEFAPINQEQLTTQPRPSKLERRGDIFMPGEPGGETPPIHHPAAETSKKPSEPTESKPTSRHLPVTPERQQEVREAWMKRREEQERGGERITREQLETEEKLIRMGIPPISEGSGDEPEDSQGQPTETDAQAPERRTFKPSAEWQEIPRGVAIPPGATIRMDMESGKNYAKWDTPPETEIEYEFVAGSSAGGGGQEPPAPPNGSPLEPEESDDRNEQEKTRETLIEIFNSTKEEILFNVFEIEIDKMSPEAAKEFILQTNKAIVEVLTGDLPQASKDSYKDALKQLEELSAEEARTEYKNTLENIRKERKQAGLEQPLVKEALERFRKEAPEISPSTIDPGNGGSDEDENPLTPDEEVSGTTSAEDAKDVNSPFRFISDDEGFIDQLGKDPERDEMLIEILRGSINLPGLIDSIYQTRPKAKQKAHGLLQSILSDKDGSRVKENLTDFIGNLRNEYEGGEGKEKTNAVDEYRINSIQGLARVIASKTNSELYGPTGEHKLIDEKGKFYPENFVLWVREQAVRLHEDNRNTEMYPLSAIVLSTGYRDISLYMMTRTNREQYFRDQDSGIVMDDLADELINEAFYFGVYRNTNLAYFQVMGQDEELPKAVVQFHARNDLTSGDGLEKMLSAPGDFSEKETDTKVGDAIRIANDIYYNLSDYEELGKIFGADSLKGEKPLTIIDIENALRIIQKKKDWSGDNDDEKLENFDSFDKNTRNEFHYDASSHTLKGKYYDKDKKEKEVNLLLGNGIIDLKEFVRFMNIYNYATPLANRVDLLREIIKIKVAEKTGLEAGIALTAEEKQVKKDKWEKDKKARGDKEADRIFMAKRKSERININYAETSSYVMQRPIGAAAQNDTGRIGFDAATKLFMKDYLIRQSGEDTTGPIGVPDEIGIFNALSTDLWTGLRTESGDSPYEIFMRLRDIDNDKELSPEAKRELKKEQIGKLRFKERAESDFAANQISRAFQILHAQLGAEQLDLNKIVTFDLMQGIRYNPKEFEDQIKEKFIKPMRYAFSSNSALKYSSQVRIYDLENDPERKRKSYRAGSLAEKMFGPEVLEGILERDKDGKVTIRDKDGIIQKDASYLDTSDGRTALMKHAARARVAAQLRYHRKFRSVGERWTFMRTETFLMALQTLKEVEEDEAHPGRVKETNKGFFSKEDIAWIRENSGSEVLRMVMIDSIADGGKNLPAGLFDALVKLVQGIAKG